ALPAGLQVGGEVRGPPPGRPAPQLGPIPLGSAGIGSCGAGRDRGVTRRRGPNRASASTSNPTRPGRRPTPPSTDLPVRPRSGSKGLIERPSDAVNAVPRPRPGRPPRGPGHFLRTGPVVYDVIKRSERTPAPHRGGPGRPPGRAPPRTYRTQRTRSRPAPTTPRPDRTDPPRPSDRRPGRRACDDRTGLVNFDEVT